METDPITGKPYPKEAIQRVLHISQKVLVYRIPPITSTRGFAAASWTQNPADQIFIARLRIIETAIPVPRSTSGGEEKISVTIILEDASSGQLFAAAPYDRPTVVEQANDSSRFFAIRVVGGGGMRATLGIGYEERADAFEFSVSLQDVRRTLGMEAQAGGASGFAAPAPRGGMRPGVPGRGPASSAAPAAGSALPAQSNIKRDFSLKEGETITINIGGRGRRTAPEEPSSGGGSGGGLFSLAPPPGSRPATTTATPFLPPPPSASSIKADMQAQDPGGQTKAEDLGFDDGEFGEFQ